MDHETMQNLAKMAIEAKGFSYSPYSKFKVGAALLCKSGKIYSGCNIENSAYSPTNCAERTAVFKAVSEGEKEFLAIAIAGGVDGEIAGYCYPCGVCRQVLAEFVDKDSFELLIVKNESDIKVHKFNELFPFGFEADILKK